MPQPIQTLQPVVVKTPQPVQHTHNTPPTETVKQTAGNPTQVKTETQIVEDAEKAAAQHQAQNPPIPVIEPFQVIVKGKDKAELIEKLKAELKVLEGTKWDFGPTPTGKDWEPSKSQV